jgi:hypothetical protein
MLRKTLTMLVRLFALQQHLDVGMGLHVLSSPAELANITILKRMREKRAERRMHLRFCLSPRLMVLHLRFCLSPRLLRWLLLSGHVHGRGMSSSEVTSLDPSRPPNKLLRRPGSRVHACARGALAAKVFAADQIRLRRKRRMTWQESSRD